MVDPAGHFAFPVPRCRIFPFSIIIKYINIQGQIPNT